MRQAAAIETDFQLNALLDSAMQEPVLVKRGQQEGIVLMSQKQYDQLRGEATREFLEFCDKMAAEAAANGLTEEKLREILDHA